MKISLDWLNTYLDSPVDADTADHALTNQGLPIEARENVAGSASDVMLDVEVTSNRADCLSHIGIAREIAAGTARRLILPEVPTDQQTHGDSIEQSIGITVDDVAACPQYTARIIRGITVKPSPHWLVQRLEAIGMRSVNNVVDVTNFILMETGQPLHAFDLATLDGSQVNVRYAKANELFEAIDATKHQLRQDMLVIADAAKPVALAGVMGGMNTEVTGSTTDILLESAQFDPLSIRNTSRALKLSSESSYRFERAIDPQQVHEASRRATAMICELAGGTPAPGVIHIGSTPAPCSPIQLRLSRCSAVMGLDITLDQATNPLNSLGFNPVQDTANPDAILCQPPAYRSDVTREIDLIEEVARLHGYDPVPVEQKIHIVAQPVQPDIAARRVIRNILTAHGFCETLNPSLITEDHVKPFSSPKSPALYIDHTHRRPDRALRPSLVPSLLACRSFNQNLGNEEVRLFEMGTVWPNDKSNHYEAERLTAVIDAQDPQKALRTIRTAIDDLTNHLLNTTASVEPAEHPSWENYGNVTCFEQSLGWVGIAAPGLLSAFNLQTRVAVMELHAEALIKNYPPTKSITPVSKYPSVERDLSILIDEQVTWSSVETTIHSANIPNLYRIQFITTYRGKPIVAGKKSVSFRMVFRDAAATLRHDQVDTQVNQILKQLSDNLSAQVREQ